MAIAKGTRLYALLQRLLRLLVRAFFREVRVAGLDNIPTDRGGVLVSWHPNGLVDPGLILTHFPHAVVFGARHGLFRWPLLGFLLRALGTVPIFRAQDSKDKNRGTKNQQSLSALAQRIGDGSFSALFPEGDSHDNPHLSALKTGAARLYLEARDKAAPGEPVIIPVGLHYDKKRVFRSRALIVFHPPMHLPAPLLELAEKETPSPEAEKSRARKITDLIERELQDVVHATDDWRLHHTMHRARKLVRAERALLAGARNEKPDVEDKILGFARVRIAYYTRAETHPEEVAALRERVEQYDRELAALGLEDHELDHPPRLASIWLPIILLFQVILVFFLLPPLLLLGYIVNGPTALFVLAIAHLGAKRGKDIATIKMLLGALLFPLTWVAVGILGAFAHEQVHALFPTIPNTFILSGFLLALLAALGGVLSLRYLHLAQETWSAVRVRLTRARQKVAISRLKVERADIYQALMVHAEGLDLPGVVDEDGRIHAG